jgi:cytochrome P450
MLNRDPPDHTRLRMLVHKAFTPQLIEGLRQRIQHIADELIDAMVGRGEVDLIDAFAFPLPIIVISEMLGLPPEERDRVRRWADAFVSNPEQDPEAVRMMKLIPYVEEFAAYLRQKMAERRTHPREDLLSALVHVEEEGTRLDEKELVSMGFLLLLAGHETTVNLIAGGMVALLDHPAELARLRAEPSLMRSAVEELLRYAAPVETASGRFAGESFEFYGRPLKKGDLVLASLASANRDPAHFREPERLDLGREDNKHLGFGLGIHYCLGAPLARLEGQIAFTRLLTRLPRIRLAVPRETIEWRPTLLVRGPKRLPVAL